MTKLQRNSSRTSFPLKPDRLLTLEYVIASPIVMAFSSCLTLVEDNSRIRIPLFNINQSLKEWKKHNREVARSGKRMMQALFSEGFGDTLEQMMMNNQGKTYSFDYASQMTRRSNLSRMTPTHFCGLSSDVGNALIAGADEQILGSPPIVKKCTLVPKTEPQTAIRNRRIQTLLMITSSGMEQLVAQLVSAVQLRVLFSKRNRGSTGPSNGSLTMRNSITPTHIQTRSLLNTVVNLFRSPSIPLQTTGWTPQLGWHNRNWNDQPSRSSAGIGFRAGVFVVHHFQHNQTSLELHCCHFLMLSRSSTEHGWIGLPSFCPADSISCFSERELFFTELDDIDLEQSPACAQLFQHAIFGIRMLLPSLRHVRESSPLFIHKSAVYRSLVALVKTDDPFDNALQDRAAQFLKSLEPKRDENLANRLITDLVPSSAGSASGFVDSVLILLSSPHSTIVEATISPIWSAVINIENSLKEWKKAGPEVSQSVKRMRQAVFSEGFEDTLEGLLKIGENANYGYVITQACLSSSQMLGLNVTRPQ
ncbi:hypothetical protein BLNAU_22901 [Blattamonas nauphoetae]|uniref:Uncharacterized protein n=1 Tax=Blattamonas nauphoetae TaxID=2049346 RepID=A0ABQ9WSU9_9EUKA|nr:hypothetical protein BLNAU_22901 [Blattamonas nauphoetae]